MILMIQGLQKIYGKKVVIQAMSFAIDTPKILALVGPNGAGKTTLLNCICHLIPYQKGTIRIFGKPNTDPSIFRDMAYLSDQSVLYPYLTGRDHLEYVRTVQKLEAGRTEEVVKRLGMSSYLDQRVGGYSLGMKQHLLLALSLMNRPKLLILDEPLTGLDPDSIQMVRSLLLELHAQGTCILFSTHTLSEIDFVTRDILFLSKGLILEEQWDARSRSAEERYRELYHS